MSNAPMKSAALTKWLLLACAAALLGGCATPPTFDYTAYKGSRPQSILVLPPVNNSPDVNATFSVLAQVTHPLAESGYYVMPVSLVAETFKQNGVTEPAEMHAIDRAKLHEIFGADAALYLTVTKYGTTYMVFDSAAVVSASARLVDLKTGQELWSGSATASSSEQNNNNQSGGLVGLLVTAVVKQIMHSVVDSSHPIAGIASQRLLTAGRPNGMLYGPRSAHYGKD
jgi:hypothetical protein